MSSSTDNFLDGSGEHIFQGVRLAGKPLDSLWNVSCSKGYIKTISSYQQKGDIPPDNRFLARSLCHPHIHLDKCFLLLHPKYADLEIQEGDFAEAMKLTSEAKSRFEPSDLLERGRALIEESISFGVTHMRAFVEVDAVVGLKCLEAGLSLKAEFSRKCYIQICAFAQDPLFSYEDDGREMRALFLTAATTEGVEAIGSTPYVEATENQKTNIKWMVQLAQERKLLLDFHLDYSLDAFKEAMVHYVISTLRAYKWRDHAVTLGHCTRLTLFSAAEWQELRQDIGDLPIHFVGLPTSDLFMMGRPSEQEGGGVRNRGTLQIPQMVRRYTLSGAIGINNVGNAFTPQGSCDPMALAALALGVYQAGTKGDAEVILQCISTRAKVTIGLGGTVNLELKQGDPAHLVLFGSKSSKGFRTRKTVQEVVYDAGRDRAVVYAPSNN